MWLNVSQAKLTSKQCWSAVCPAIVGVAQYLQQGHLVPINAVACLQLFVRCYSNSQFTLWFFPIPPSLLRFGLGECWLGKYSTELFNQCDVAWWGPLAGLPLIPPHARALPGSNFEGTNAQARLLVMSLMVGIILIFFGKVFLFSSTMPRIILFLTRTSYAWCKNENLLLLRMFPPIVSVHHYCSLKFKRHVIYEHAC